MVSLNPEAEAYAKKTIKAHDGAASDGEEVHRKRGALAKDDPYGKKAATDEKAACAGRAAAERHQSASRLSGDRHHRHSYDEATASYPSQGQVALRPFYSRHGALCRNLCRAPSMLDDLSIARELPCKHGCRAFSMGRLRR